MSEPVTHYAECWRDHLECARRRVVELEVAYRNLQRINRRHEATIRKLLRPPDQAPTASSSRVEGRPRVRPDNVE